MLLVLFFTAFCWKNLSKKRFLKHLIVQIFIGGIIIILIRNVFATNPGEAIETYHLKDNISFWSSPRSYFLFFDPYYLGLPIFPRGGNILSILFVVFLVFYKWREKPLSVKRLFIYTFIINLPLFIYACHRDELRNFSLVFPSIFLLGVHTAYNLIHKKA